MEMKSPITFHDDIPTSKGIYFQNTGSQNEIVITKDNTEHVIAGRLFVEFNGTKIFTDINNIILINKSDNTIQIINHKELSAPEEREYVILVKYPDNYDDDSCRYISILGRQETFDHIKLIASEIDVEESIILAETTSLKDSISVYDFMKQMIDNELVDNSDGFDIDDYIM